MIYIYFTQCFNIGFSRWVFETGRLAPGYDLFRCVVNIPEDVQRVGDPAEDGEQMSVMAHGITPDFTKNSFPQSYFFRCYGEDVRGCDDGR